MVYWAHSFVFVPLCERFKLNYRSSIKLHNFFFVSFLFVLQSIGVTYVFERRANCLVSGQVCPGCHILTTPACEKTVRSIELIPGVACYSSRGDFAVGEVQLCLYSTIPLNMVSSAFRFV